MVTLRAIATADVDCPPPGKRANSGGFANCVLRGETKQLQPMQDTFHIWNEI